MGAAIRSRPSGDPGLEAVADEADLTPAADAEADADGWALLEGLRRRLDEQAVQARKTQQQVSQLAESIGALVEGQRRRARGLNLNSFVAYLIFTMLCGAGFYFLYQSRAGTLIEARDAAQRERDLAVRRSDEAAARATAREQADGRAWEVYQLLEAGKRTEASDKLAALGALPLSRTERAILAARAHETQVMAVDAALKAAAAAFKAGRHGDVIAPLEAALLSEPAGARAVLMRYFLGVAYAKASQFDPAVAHLQAAIDGDTDQDDARFQLASALDRSGAYGKARAEYDRFATAHPQSPLAVYAMRRSATLARMPATAPAAVPPAAPFAPAAPFVPGGARPGMPPAAAPARPGSAPGRPAGPAPTGAMPRPVPGAWAPAKPATPVPPAVGAGAGQGSSAPAPAGQAPAMAPATQPPAASVPAPVPVPPPSAPAPAAAPAQP